jgi:glycosyltransferase involved in cell wall biosynthesis
MVSLTPFFGGGEVHFVKLAALLARHYQVRALAVNGEACSRLSGLDLDVVRLPDRAATSIFGRYYCAANELHRQCGQFRPHAVHLNGQAECYLSLIPWSFRIPIVATRHVPFNEHIRGIRRLLVRLNLQLAVKVICVSASIRTQLSPVIALDKLVVIPNWLDYIPEPRRDTDNSRIGIFRLLFLGRIEVMKGIFDLIEAMRLLKDVTLDVVGSGVDLGAAQAAAAGLPVTFHGFQVDCGPYFRAADLLVFPSYSEGLAQVPLEAMAHGLPCLITDIEGALEAADGGACAEVFHCGNSRELAQKVAGLQKNSARLLELRELGHFLVRQLCGIQTI